MDECFFGIAFIDRVKQFMTNESVNGNFLNEETKSKSPAVLSENQMGESALDPHNQSILFISIRNFLLFSAIEIALRLSRKKQPPMSCLS
jgi:hypothetical protein